VRLLWRKRAPERYPPWVVSDEERERWDLAEGIARRLFGDVGPDHVWMAARSIYQGPIPTRTSGDDDPVVE
jgi:hypothetical protein